MERAGKVIANWKAGRACVALEDLSQAAWRAAVGDKIARHTVGVNLVRQHLIVQVEDQMWKTQLWSLRGQILGKLAEVLGRGVVEDVEFRVGRRRIGPGREESLPDGRRTGTVTVDEADSISDPGLKAIYKRARRKALA